MRLRFIYTFFVLGFLAFIIMSHSAGRAADKNWGNTGAPGDETLANGSSRTCVTCHNNSADLQVTLNIDLMDQDGNSVIGVGYIPGNDYTLKVAVDAAVGTPSGYGFQAVCLNGEVNVDAAEVSNYSNPSANVQISTASNTGRTYVEQDGVSASNEFTVTWSAPADLAGPVTFYSCGNGVNDNGMNSGDGAACSTLTVQAFSVGTSILDNAVQFEVFPNPAAEYLQLTIDGQQSEPYQVKIANIVGQTVHAGNYANGQHEINIAFLPKGSYFLRIGDGQRFQTRKILKL